MRDAGDIARFIEARPEMMRLLAAVAALGLPTAWIGAGFIRNAVWDALHGSEAAGRPTDVDVVYFDPADIAPERDLAAEARLRRTVPAVDWSVKNQARMHLRNGDPPYRDVADALRHWPETATAIAARLNHGKVELLAPYGVGDLLGLVARPTPPFAARVAKMETYRERVRDKGWRQRWPRLTLLDAEPI